MSLGSSDIGGEAMRKAVQGGAEHIAAQLAHVQEAEEAEAARRAALGDATLPEGTYATKAEALAYLDAARAAGKFVQAIDDGTGSGALTLEISSPYNGYETVWITSVLDEDPNPPLNVDLKEG